jgi:AraC-like DNA-binding protein
MDVQSTDIRDAVRVGGVGRLSDFAGRDIRLNNQKDRAIAAYGRDVSTRSIVERLRRVFRELFSPLDDALHDNSRSFDERIQRVSDLLRDDPELHRLVMPEATNETASELRARGGLTPWNARLIRQHVEQNLEGTLRNKDLAAIVGLSESHFYRAFKDSFGDTPHRYILRVRVERARQLLLTTDVSLGQIALDCGLADQAHFCRLFRRFHGESPGAFRRARVTVSASTSSSS